MGGGEGPTIGALNYFESDQKTLDSGSFEQSSPSPQQNAEPFSF